MLAAVPPSWMIPWTRRVAWQLLAPQADRHEQGDHRVERVAAVPGLGCRVGLQAGEGDVHVLGREWIDLDVAPVAGVKQQRRVEALEQAVVDHDGLAAPPLLRGRAQEHDLAGPVVADRGERDRRPDARRRHRVVAAAVPETGQRVVLGEDPDARTIGAEPAGDPAADRGLEAAGGMLDGVPVAADGLGDPGGGLALLERGLGVGMDPMGQGEDLVPARLDGVGDARLEVGERLGWAGGGQGVGHGRDPIVRRRG